MNNKKWYCVQTYSQSEKRAKSNLEERIKLKGFEQKFGEIFIPTKTVQIVYNGHSKTKEQCSFPGYMFVEMELDEKTWYLVKETSKVVGFAGAPGTKEPTEIKQSEIDVIRDDVYKSNNKHKFPTKPLFDVGANIKVIDGPFSNFSGVVEEINLEKQKICVKITIFDRKMPVELNFDQIVLKTIEAK